MVLPKYKSAAPCGTPKAITAIIKTDSRGFMVGWVKKKGGTSFEIPPIE